MHFYRAPARYEEEAKRIPNGMAWYIERERRQPDMRKKRSYHFMVSCAMMLEKHEFMGENNGDRYQNNVYNGL